MKAAQGKRRMAEAEGAQRGEAGVQRLAIQQHLPCSFLSEADA